VLELGAGVGLASLTAASMGAHVWLTDCELTVLALAHRSVVANAHLIQEHKGQVTTRVLDWRRPIGSDSGASHVQGCHNEHPISSACMPCSSDVASYAVSGTSILDNRMLMPPSAGGTGADADARELQETLGCKTLGEQIQCMTAADWESVFDCEVLLNKACCFGVVRRA
jgi:hypothetical protein